MKSLLFKKINVASYLPNSLFVLLPEKSSRILIFLLSKYKLLTWTLLPMPPKPFNPISRSRYYQVLKKTILKSSLDFFNELIAILFTTEWRVVAVEQFWGLSFFISKMNMLKMACSMCRYLNLFYLAIELLMVPFDGVFLFRTLLHDFGIFFCWQVIEFWYLLRFFILLDLLIDQIPIEKNGFRPWFISRFCRLGV